MMTLHGVDVFVWSAQIPKLPEKIGAFELKLITSRGTRVWPPPAPAIIGGDWPRCRFLSEGEVTDDQVDELVSKVTELGFKWTMCQKLYRQDGVDQFSQAY